MKQRILIAGGSGLIGRVLSRQLEAAGHEVRWLSRHPDPQGPYPAFAWDPAQKKADPAALQDIDTIINLAGEGIADKRWCRARKRQILQSRLDANACFQHLQESGQLHAKTYISAAAMGYYGYRGNRWVDEDSAPGQKGFLAECCREWEKAIRGVAHTGLRTAWLRIGLVLSREGGAFPAMRKPFLFGLGTYFGPAQLYQSWLHIEDLAAMFVLAATNPSMQGPYNAAAPEPLRGREFAAAIRESLERPAVLLHIPDWLSSLLLGEMAEVLQSGARMHTEKIRQAGFKYRFGELEKALLDLA